MPERVLTPILLGWRNQYNRMVRGAEKLARAYSTSIEYQDDLQHFFQDCWHLHDWIEHDRSQRKEPGIGMALERYPALRVIQELGMACRYGHHDKTDLLGAYVVGDDGEGTSTGRGTVTRDVLIRMSDGTELLARELVRDAVLAWKDLLEKKGLL